MIWHEWNAALKSKDVKLLVISNYSIISNRLALCKDGNRGSSGDGVEDLRLILGLHLANERWRYFVTTSLIGWAQT